MRVRNKRRARPGHSKLVLGRWKGEWKKEASASLSRASAD